MNNFASIHLDLSAICSFVSNVFIKNHEYSNKFVFISAHKVRFLCSSITLISSLLLKGNYQQSYGDISFESSYLHEIFPV